MEEVKTKTERTPEQQATHDKEMKELAKVIRSSAPADISSQAAFCLADMVRAVIDGRLKPEAIPPTADELLVITYGAVARKVVDRKIREMLGGLQ